MKDGLNIKVRLVKLSNILLMSIPFFISWYNYYNLHTRERYYWKGNLTMFVLYALLYYLMNKIYDGLDISISRVSESVLSQILSAMLADGLIYIVIFLIAGRFLSIVPGLQVILCQIVISIIWCFIVSKIYFHILSPVPTAIIYDKKQNIDELINQYGLDKKYDVKGIYEVDDILKNQKVLKEFEVVFITLCPIKKRNEIVKYCVNNNIDIFVSPRISDVVMLKSKDAHMFYLPMLSIEGETGSLEYLFIKRCFDIVLSLLGLIILSPIFLITAIAIKINDGGPIFYKQVRLTKNGKEFEILKFRSMKVDAEKDGVAKLSSGDKDDRVTSVGRFIRKCRIDELPQLINILKGDLSIVGPRPERPEIAKQYEKKIPEFNLRLKAKAGLTGYAQVYGKYNTTPYNKLQMDLMYIAHPGLIEDFKIILATVKILFVPESTEGFESTDED